MISFQKLNRRGEVGFAIICGTCHKPIRDFKKANVLFDEGKRGQLAYVIVHHNCDPRLRKLRLACINLEHALRPITKRAVTR